MFTFLLKRIGFLIVLTLPLWNGFRMDIDNNKLFLFNFELGYTLGYLFFLFLLFVIVGFLGLSIVTYRAFCNTSCPHNAVSSMLFRMEAKLGPNGKPLVFIVSAAISLFMAYVTVSYFYDPTTIFNSIIGFEMNKYFWLTMGLATIYTVLTFKARSSFCKVCPYGLAQQIAFVGAKKRSELITHPGVWITWGTSLVLLFFLVVGWGVN